MTIRHCPKCENDFEFIVHSWGECCPSCGLSLESLQEYQSKIEKELRNKKTNKILKIVFSTIFMLFAAFAMLTNHKALVGGLSGLVFVFIGITIGTIFKFLTRKK